MRAPYPDRSWFCVRETGVKHGAFFSLFPDQAIEIEGSYKDGRLDGAWKRHYPGGALAEEGIYVAGQRDGTWRQHARDGSLLGEYKLKAGTGKAKRWYDDGGLYSEMTLKKGAPHGPMTVRNHDGSVVITAKYWSGKLDDKHVVGAKSSLRIEESYFRGVRRGPRKIWQYWALLIDEAYDNRGRLDGGFTIWRDKRVPRVQGTYANGKKVGTWIWNDRNNLREREGDFVDGKKSGTWNEYFDTKLTFTGNYTDGKPDGEFVYYDRSGGALGTFRITAGNGTMVTFHSNRKPASKVAIRNGLMHGAYEELTPRGKTLVEGRYANDRRHGRWREWNDNLVLVSEVHYKRGRIDGAFRKYTDGTLAVEATYKDGKAEGPYTELRAGKPYLTGQFAADKRVGTWTIFDATGTATLTATYKDGVLDGPWRQVLGGVVTEITMVAGWRTP